MNDPVYCGVCKAPVARADAFCRHCGADLLRPASPAVPGKTVRSPRSGSPPSPYPAGQPALFKTCPACGQPAVLAMPVCGRCGAPYPPVAGATTPRSEYPRGASAAIRSRQGSRWRRPVVAGLCVIAALLVSAILISEWRPGPGDPADRAPGLTVESSGPVHEPEAPDSGAAQGGGSLVQSSGPFQERPSSIETPTIRFTSLCPDTSLVRFLDQKGRAYELQVGPGATESLQLPAGDYDFQLGGDNPDIRGQSGDATFRRYHEYDLSIADEPAYDVPDHAHLGD